MTSAARMISKIATRNQNSHQRRAGTLLLMLMAGNCPQRAEVCPAILAILAALAARLASAKAGGSGQLPPTTGEPVNKPGWRVARSHGSRRARDRDQVRGDSRHL